MLGWRLIVSAARKGPLQDPEFARLSTLVGGLVRQARESRGWSSAEFARRAGVSRDRLVWLERGERRPNSETLRRLAVALHPDSGRRAERVAAFLVGVAGPALVVEVQRPAVVFESVEVLDHGV